MYQHVDIDRFHGLNHRDDPTEVGFAGAVQALDVRVTDGVLRPKPGNSTMLDLSTGQFTDFAQINTALVTFRAGGGTSTVTVIDESLGTTAVGNLGAGSDVITGITSFGAPGNQEVYLAFGSALGWAKVGYNGAAYSITTGLGGAKPWLLATTPWDNRIVMANFSAAAHSPTGSQGSPSTVFFSDPGAPSTFLANNYVLLNPGDGESIRAIAVWRDQLLVFKESRMYVFTAPTVGAAGEPVFPFRVVALGTRLNDIGVYRHGTAVSADGVYFVAVDGIYRTDGFTVQPVSDQVRPIFNRTSRYRGTTYELDNGLTYGDLGVVGARLFYRYTNASGNPVLLVLEQGEWVQWSVGAAYTVPFGWYRPGGGDSTYFGDGHALIRYEDLTVTHSGSAITSSYLTHPQVLADGEEATVRQVELAGSGTVKVTLAQDGVSPAGFVSVTGGGLARAASRGRSAALAVQADAGGWLVDRAVLHVRETRAGAR